MRDRDWEFERYWELERERDCVNGENEGTCIYKEGFLIFFGILFS